jgi:starvation-inducible DNA-binding protein
MTSPTTTSTTTPPFQTSSIIISLNQLFSLLVEQYFVYKHFHWHLTGQDFYSFHLLFDKHAGTIYETWDTIAERIRQLDGRVESLLTEIQTKNTLEMYNTNQEMSSKLQEYIIPNLLKSHESVIAQMQILIATSTDKSDPATADVITNMLEDQQQMQWFIKSSKE